MQGKIIADNLGSRAGEKYRAAGVISHLLFITPQAFTDQVSKELKGEAQNPKEHIDGTELENRCFAEFVRLGDSGILVTLSKKQNESTPEGALSMLWKYRDPQEKQFQNAVFE